jgi:hypothetical protein
LPNHMVKPPDHSHHPNVSTAERLQGS